MGSEKHIRPRSMRKALSKCREGKHRYGAASDIGGGMSRQICTVCGAVTIDLTQAYQPAEGRRVASPGVADPGDPQL